MTNDLEIGVYNKNTIAGMINGGFGETHINSILAASNIPSTEEEGGISRTPANFYG